MPSGSDLSGVNYAELRIRRRADSPIDRLIIEQGKHYCNGKPCEPFDFWAEHDNAHRVIALRLRHNVPEKKPI